MSYARWMMTFLRGKEPVVWLESHMEIKVSFETVNYGLVKFTTYKFV
jgi:hypothetical protein